MKHFITVALVCIALVIGTFPAQAGGRYHKGHYYGHKGYHGGYHHGFKRGHKHFEGYRGGYKRGHYKHRGNYGDDILIGAGIIGGSILLGSLLTRPAYPVASPYYFQRAPVCTQDQVYRYLPDGRVQWGTRTRCY